MADVGAFFKNSFVAVLKGEFLLRLNIGRYFVHIVFTFLLFGITIWLSLMIETTMARVERNKATLKELEIVHNAKTFEAASLTRRSTVQAALADMGSEVSQNGEPATILK